MIYLGQGFTRVVQSELEGNINISLIPGPTNTDNETNEHTGSDNTKENNPTQETGSKDRVEGKTDSTPLVTLFSMLPYAEKTAQLTSWDRKPLAAQILGSTPLITYRAMLKNPKKAHFLVYR